MYSWLDMVSDQSVSFFSEELYERLDFQERELAALVTSKVYYHLGAFQDSLTFALGAGQMFDVNGTSEYIETILCECVCVSFNYVMWLSDVCSCTLPYTHTHTHSQVY